MSNLLRNHQPGSGMRWVVAITVALTLTAFLAVGVNSQSAGNVDGVWGNPTPSNTSDFRWCYAPDNTTGPAGAPTTCSTSNANIQNPPGSTTTDENQFRYGNPASGSGSANRSGYGFNGNNSVGAMTPYVPFYLGRFTHYNRPITADNALTGIGLSVTLSNLLCGDGNPPAQGSTQTFAYSFNHHETPNSPGSNPGGVCPYPHPTNATAGCADRVQVSSLPDKTFNCIIDSVTVTYTLQILGFHTNANCHESATGPTSTTFITGEGQDNPACLWAAITDPEFPLAVTLNSFEAKWVENQVLVTWDTVSEFNNLGFNLYRSESPDQQGVLITPQFIPSQSPGSLQGYAYSFVDTDVTPGQTYWYSLEDLDMSGVSFLQGPVSAAPQNPTAVTLAGLSAATSRATPVWPVLAMATIAIAGLAVGLRLRTLDRAR